MEVGALSSFSLDRMNLKPARGILEPREVKQKTTNQGDEKK